MKTCLVVGLLFCFHSVFSQKIKKPTNCKTKPDDVSINEIFADPSSPIALPKAKFIELKNNTNQSISLKGWVYRDIVKKFTFKEDSIKANEYLIICDKKDTDKFKTYGRVIGISSWPTPNHLDDMLRLENECGTIISQVNYTETWYRNRKRGGCTLELINPHTSSKCIGIHNWNASIDPSGGTPGKQNSIYTITPQALKVTQAILLDDTHILLLFNHTIDQNSASVVSNYTVNHGIGTPISATPALPYFDRVTLQFGVPITEGIHYQITAQNIIDCTGNTLSSEGNPSEFMLTKQITAGDILINEVLFSPRQGGVEFVEIYNNSSNSLDLKDLFLTTDRNNVLTNLHPITPVSYIIKANQYLVLSTNPDQVKAHYHTENPNAFLRMKSLPPFTDKGKTIILISNSIPIDQFDYDENMHFKLIKDQKGVSLERSSFNRPANEPGNFRSATSSVGFATPGYKNSQYMGPITSNEEFTLKSKTFSPDNDGFEDLMHINYKFPEPPGVATINIYNAQGMLVRRLVKNQTLAAEGTIYWNGLDEQNKQATVGIYIIHTEIFDLNGNVKRYRKPCVLATKLN